LRVGCVVWLKNCQRKTKKSRGVENGKKNMVRKIPGKVLVASWELKRVVKMNWRAAWNGCKNSCEKKNSPSPGFRRRKKATGNKRKRGGKGKCDRKRDEERGKSRQGRKVMGRLNKIVCVGRKSKQKGN